MYKSGLPEVPEVPPGEDELPYRDEVPVESDKHIEQIVFLRQLFQRHFADRDDVHVASDLGLYYSETQAREGNTFRAPDLMVVLDTVRRARKSWVVWQEERTPDLVMEILSDSTRKDCEGEKRRIYERVLKVTNYVMFDPDRGDLTALELVGGRYAEVEPNAEGRYWLVSVGLFVGRWEGTHPSGFEPPWIRLFDAKGVMLPRSDELVAQERARSQALEAEIAALKAELGKG